MGTKTIELPRVHFEKRIARHLDWYLIACVLFLNALSIPIIDSASYAMGEHNVVKKQAILVVCSLLMMAFGTFVDYRDLVNLSPHIYGVTLGLLVLVFFVGKEAGGSTRWIPLGIFDLQPSEVAKLSTILFCTYVLSRIEEPLVSYPSICLFYCWVLIPTVLILKQPDLGTATTLIAAATGILYFGGTPGRRIARLLLVAAALTAIIILLHVYAHLPLPIEEYQLKRITSLFNPDKDPLHTGYQVLQSKIAIGSGSLWGKGLGKGTQNRLSFIPQQHTDFIFSVVGEELGFIKTVMLIGVYMLLSYRCLLAAIASPDRKGTLVAGGVLSLFLFHILVNAGMTMGLMPVTGVPLPFLSHGGSALLVDSFAVGMVLNVGWKRHKILF